LSIAVGIRDKHLRFGGGVARGRKRGLLPRTRALLIILIDRATERLRWR
jgi:hypothetical protein